MTSVPIVDEGQLESITDEGLTFVAVVRRYEGAGGLDASLHALADLVAVGSLKWDAWFTGEVTSLEVKVGQRRRGIATSLWEVATELAISQGWKTPEHSKARTAEGNAWAVAMGAEPAETIIPVHDGA